MAAEIDGRFSGFSGFRPLAEAPSSSSEDVTG